MIALGLAWYFSANRHDTRIEHQFNSVTNGMNEQQVLSMMGKPHTIGK
jgi:outer membrane protein assembly factor BamE (lipoprotein component of BamABCDE complex)